MGLTERALMRRVFFDRGNKSMARSSSRYRIVRLLKLIRNQMLDQLQQALEFIRLHNLSLA
jgi:hypothetical protein